MNSFTWWFFNLGVTLVWLAVVVKSGSWSLALPVVPYLVIAFLIELPGTSSTESWDDDRDDGWLG
ncbi:MAG TPA: hypothetical protein VIT93_05040 [Dehalococcoidia bacterium]